MGMCWQAVKGGPRIPPQLASLDKSFSSSASLQNSQSASGGLEEERSANGDRSTEVAKGDLGPLIVVVHLVTVEKMSLDAVCFCMCAVAFLRLPCTVHLKNVVSLLLITFVQPVFPFFFLVWDYVWQRSSEDTSNTSQGQSQASFATDGATVSNGNGSELDSDDHTEASAPSISTTEPADDAMCPLCAKDFSCWNEGIRNALTKLVREN